MVAQLVVSAQPKAAGVSREQTAVGADPPSRALLRHRGQRMTFHDLRAVFRGGDTVACGGWLQETLGLPRIEREVTRQSAGVS